MEEAVIQADFVDFKNIKSRSKMQLIFEVDIAMAKHVLDVLGYPDNAKSVACAVAKLREGVVEKQKSLAGQAKMLAFDEEFWKYIRYRDTVLYTEVGAFEAENYIEAHCGIKSCSELIEGSEAVVKFRELRNDFNAWRDYKGYQR